MTLRVTARGITGRSIRGRLVHKGKPIRGAEVGLIVHDTPLGRWYPEIRIGTKAGFARVSKFWCARTSMIW